MYSYLFLLFPCRICLFAFGLLLPPASRADWRREWWAELYWNQRYGQSVVTLYQLCKGCWADAAWHFAEDVGGREHALHRLRLPSTCIYALVSILGLLIVGSHGLEALRTIASPLRYFDQSNLMLVSRTGRLESIRRGIPAEFAERWAHGSRFVAKMAMATFPRRMPLVAPDVTGRPVVLAASSNLLAVLGLPLSQHSRQLLSESDRTVVVTDRFWREHLHARSDLLGRKLFVDGRDFKLGAILPSGFWFLSPAVQVVTLEHHPPTWEGLLVVRTRTSDPKQLEHDLLRAGDNTEYEFLRTAPHVTPLVSATLTPVWLFAAALFCALTLLFLARGYRNILADTFRSSSAHARWQWSAFFVLKMILTLTIVFLLGIEVFVGREQTVTEVLGGPLLFWFYITGCSLTVFAVVSDQHARCRVCRRLLAFPISIGCPGCLLLNWAGTEFLCPQGHGALYVPHHVACWEPDDRWIALEA